MPTYWIHLYALFPLSRRFGGAGRHTLRPNDDRTIIFGSRDSDARRSRSYRQDEEPDAPLVRYGPRKSGEGPTVHRAPACTRPHRSSARRTPTSDLDLVARRAHPARPQDLDSAQNLTAIHSPDIVIHICKTYHSKLDTELQFSV